MKISGKCWLLIIVLSSCAIGASAQTTKAERQEIKHDPEIDKKQRQGRNHNRKYLREKLAPYNINSDSLQDIVDNLNRETQAKEWEYQVSTSRKNPGQIRKVYKSHRNPDGSSGRTDYGDEYRRRADLGL